MATESDGDVANDTRVPDFELGLKAPVRTARSELKALSVLGAPIVLTQMSQMGMSIIDMMFAGRVSAADLAGVGLGASLFWPTMLLTSGLLFALTPTVAQLYGAGRANETGAVARQAGWIALAGAIVVILVLLNATPIYTFFDVDPVGIPIAVGYLESQAWGIFALFGYFVFRNLCEGLALTLPAMVIGLMSLGLKIPLNMIFVNGALGIEGQGGIGCGVSSAIIFWIQFFAIAIAVFATRIRRSGVFQRFDKPDFAEIGRLVRLGLPIGTSIFAEVSFFSGIVMLIGRFGVDVVASHNIATSFAGVAFMIPLAIGMSSTIRVGASVGAREFGHAWLTVRVAVMTALAIGCVSALVMLLGRKQLVTLYNEEPQVVALASMLFLYCAFFQLFDCAQVVMMGSLRGYKDTTKPMFIAIGAYWGIGMPIGLAFGFGWVTEEPIGVVGFWWGLCAGLAAAAFGLSIRIKRTANAYISGRRQPPPI